MTTQELKNKIEKVLGNNIRCLLPSYWWKNVFHSVVDRIDEVEQKIDGIEIPDGVPIVSSIAELDSLNLNKGRVASVVDGIGFSQCYQPTEEELSSLAYSEELYSKLTRVESIDIKNNPLEEGEVGVAALVDFRGTELSYLAIVCVKQDGLTQMFVYGIISGQDVVSVLTTGNIDRINKILSEYDMRFLAAKLDGLFEGDPEASLAALDKKFTINIDVDAYIKGGSWERLAKERDLEGIGGGTINADGVEIRELRVNSNLSDEDKAYNIETVELYKEGKAVVVTPIWYYQTSTERTDRMMAPFFVDLHTGDSTKLATFRFLNPVMDETDPFDRGFIQEITVVISNDGSASATERSLYDVAMSDTSTRAVQNKVIKKYIDDAIANVGGGSDIVVDTEISSTSTNPVQNKVVYSELQKKQGTISDLADIRSGAALGKTALQSVPSEYVTENELTQKGYATTSQVNDKQDKISDLDSIRAGAALGATALQSVPAGYVTSALLEQEITNVERQITGVAATVPQNISQLNNDSRFTTEEYVNTQVRTAIISALNTEV